MDTATELALQWGWVVLLALAGIGIILKALRLYPIRHAVTGRWMLGSRLGGGSGAGTVGIIAGTGRILIGLPISVLLLTVGTWAGIVACLAGAAVLFWSSMGG